MVETWDRSRGKWWKHGTAHARNAIDCLNIYPKGYRYNSPRVDIYQAIRRDTTNARDDFREMLYRSGRFPACSFRSRSSLSTGSWIRHEKRTRVEGDEEEESCSGNASFLSINLVQSVSTNHISSSWSPEEGLT